MAMRGTDTRRRALGDALIELAAVSSQFNRGFLRAQRPADLASKMGPERREREDA